MEACRTTPPTTAAEMVGVARAPESGDAVGRQLKGLAELDGSEIVDRAAPVQCAVAPAHVDALAALPRRAGDPGRSHRARLTMRGSPAKTACTGDDVRSTRASPLS